MSKGDGGWGGWQHIWESISQQMAEDPDPEFDQFVADNFWEIV